MLMYTHAFETIYRFGMYSFNFFFVYFIIKNLRGISHS